MKIFILKFMRHQSGTTTIEYGLIAIAIADAIAAAAQMGVINLGGIFG
jgi:Flp pilus assembly pilin Flp